VATIFTNPSGPNSISADAKLKANPARWGNYFRGNNGTGVGFKGTGGLEDPDQLAQRPKVGGEEEVRSRAIFEILGYEGAESGLFKNTPPSNPDVKPDAGVVESRERQSALEQAKKMNDAEKAEKDRLAKEEANKAKAEEDKKIQEEKDKKKAEEEKKQRDLANFSAIKRGERADALLAGDIANKAFGGRPDAPVNPNSRRISPASTEQRQYDITKRLLFNAAQERRREINQ
jgi:outer membrane biosynthesis protein TonB